MGNSNFSGQFFWGFFRSNGIKIVSLFCHMLNKLFITTIIVVISINRGQSQSPASRVEKKIKWNLNQTFPEPVTNTFSIASHRFGTTILPSISSNFPTSTKVDIIFSDFEYESLSGFNTFKATKLKNLKGTIDPVTYHTMEGNKGFTGYYICPYKEVNGNYFILKSYKYTLKEGKPFSNGANAVGMKRVTSGSALATGQWFKFSVSQDGMYKIDASMLSAAGINLSAIDPRTIKIYGHQGGMLSEVNADFRNDDIPQNAIAVIGENDGKFNNSDFVLFYAQSPHKWNYEPARNRFVHKVNIYSDKTFFFLTFGGVNGLRMGTNGNGSNLTPDASFNWFDYFIFHEDEKENICNEGRIVMGERFDQNLIYSFNHNLPNITSNRSLNIYYYAGSTAAVNSELVLKINNNTASSINFNAYIPNYDCFDGKVGSGSVNITNPSAELSFSYNRPNTSSKAWLDYYELHCSRKLTFSEGFMTFQNIQSATATVAEYRLSNLPSSYQLFDVSDPLNVKIQEVFSDNSEYVFRGQPGGLVRRYVLNDGNTLSPVYEGTVANQNLHATGIIQFIIVSPPEFLDASNKLAEFHRTRDNLATLVVTPQQIYNEFSSGSQDISAIRDFFKHVYYSNTNPVNQLRYAMFMGDASFDYKDKIPNNSNFVPTYESEPNWDINTTYFCSDDFFGFLDPLDGQWAGNQKLEIPVNRLPVASAIEAMSMVDKIINYKNAASFGDWKNFVTLCADDADAGWEKDFVYDFEDIYTNIDTTFKNLNVRKVYIDAYRQQNLGSSQRYPEAQEAIKKEFEKGTLIFNYIGHGGEEYLATEKVIDIPLINSLKNINNLTVFFTATCEFSRYDDGKRKSAGEFVITNPNGGAIAMFTTVRVVYAYANTILTKYFWSDCAFTKIGGRWPTLGEVYKKLKNRNDQSENDWNFTLFADPALTMNYPENVVIIDSINQTAVKNQKDTIKALSKVKFSGHLEDLQGQKLTGFNGSILPTVYDKPTVFNTLSNDLPGQPIPFSLYSSILYKGENSVVNGLYSFSFVVPKDINYNYGFGKISMYAKNGTTDANGYFTDLVVGGASENAAKDVNGPKLELFVDDYSFVNGGLTDNTPLLLAKVFDENGVNTSGNGIGRDIVAIIDKGTSSEKRYVLNTFYQAELNSYTTGELAYQLEYLPDGNHTYTLKVWDVYNNSSEATINFIIRNKNEVVISNPMNFPNPFSKYTTFSFSHNMAGENLNIRISIISMSGQIVKEINTHLENSPGGVIEVEWDTEDNQNVRLASGIYFYRITVSTDDGRKTDKVEKLVILN